ncbi:MULTISPECIES: 2-hydroxy-3-keto-5-methylthiopentenyl-1-phosphate phosphatase [Bacillus]|uniref:2-hydroxy-3-keto-5-methylthiopentenyl-1- phosphate phosphatase n=1 Tax=Bacillus TaxID=1386 RepID=UPI000BB80C7A|nr:MULTISPECIES: 2-hydroxy-3-keto-5-methylthiopentenyl-1-phosphate phosphatase [Bacillus]
MRKPVIFCDFDGTITRSDNIISIMKQFAPPEWEQVKDKILSQQVSIKEGVTTLFSLLPSSKRNEITDFILQNAEIREGFAEFVAYVKEVGMELYIVSGGIDFFVIPLLNGFIEEDTIYCNESDFTGENIKIIWPHSCDNACGNNCGCCKPSLIRRLASDDNETIVIGDSITDLQAAKIADKVIARDFLVDKCKELNIHYDSFETFFDVINILKGFEVKV